MKRYPEVTIWGSALLAIEAYCLLLAGPRYSHMRVAEYLKALSWADIAFAALPLLALAFIRVLLWLSDYDLRRRQKPEWWDK
jgi:hypothetical protein